MSIVLTIPRWACSMFEGIAACPSGSATTRLNYFATKEQLVAALLDRVLGRFEPPPESDDWIEGLRAFARAHRTLLAAHAWAVAPIFSNPARAWARSGSANWRCGSSSAVGSRTRRRWRRSAA